MVANLERLLVPERGTGQQDVSGVDGHVFSHVLKDLRNLKVLLLDTSFLLFAVDTEDQFYVPGVNSPSEEMAGEANVLLAHSRHPRGIVSLEHFECLFIVELQGHEVAHDTFIKLAVLIPLVSALEFFSKQNPEVDSHLQFFMRCHEQVGARLADRGKRDIVQLGSDDRRFNVVFSNTNYFLLQVFPEQLRCDFLHVCLIL